MMGVGETTAFGAGAGVDAGAGEGVGAGAGADEGAGAAAGADEDAGGVELQAKNTKRLKINTRQETIFFISNSF
jgi:hypothetical protein